MIGLQLVSVSNNTEYDSILFQANPGWVESLNLRRALVRGGLVKLGIKNKWIFTGILNHHICTESENYDERCRLLKQISLENLNRLILWPIFSDLEHGRSRVRKWWTRIWPWWKVLSYSFLLIVWKHYMLIFR